MDKKSKIGPLMLDVAGPTLSEEDRRLLAEPLVGGLILFTRNFQNIEQLKQLVDEIRSVRPNILIAVDHEGGRVQRFKDGFTRIPPMRYLGRYYDAASQEALELATDIAWLLAIELLELGIDFSFAPVLDLDYESSEVIGDRAFHSQPDAASELCRAFVQGMQSAGMAATGKHFPGHGYVAADSHIDIPVDERSFENIMIKDGEVFRKLIADGLDAIMPAHIIYSEVDDKPAGFSTFWIQKVLRTELKFNGVVFSDDLGMEGATVAGSYSDRASAALAAGCDMILVCNDRTGVLEVLDFLKSLPCTDHKRLASMQGKLSLRSGKKGEFESRKHSIRVSIDTLVSRFGSDS